VGSHDAVFFRVSIHSCMLESVFCEKERIAQKLLGQMLAIIAVWAIQTDTLQDLQSYKFSHVALNHEPLPLDS